MKDNYELNDEYDAEMYEDMYGGLNYLKTIKNYEYQAAINELNESIEELEEDLDPELIDE